MIHRRRDVTHIVLVHFVSDPGDLIKFELRNKNFIYSTRADRAAIEQVGAVEHFNRCEEEQLVLDDRTAKIEAVTSFGIGACVDRVALERITAQAVTGVVIESAAEEIVGTRLDNGIDVTSRETAVDNIERCELDRDLVDRIV